MHGRRARAAGRCARRRGRPRARRPRQRARCACSRRPPTASRRSTARCSAGASSARSRWRTQLGIPGANDAAIASRTARATALPGFACDVLGPVAVVYAYGDGLRALGRSSPTRSSGSRSSTARSSSCARARRARGRSGRHRQRSTSARSPTSTASRYEIHPLGGLNAGLFTDMREHRAAASRGSPPAKRVLNLFSYTGALGLACARGGAAERHERRHLATACRRGRAATSRATARSRRARSSRPATRCGSSRAPRATRSATTSSSIDPPTLSTRARHGRGRSVATIRELIAQAAAVIPAGGMLWLAANDVDARLAAEARAQGPARAGRTGAIVEQGGLPPEYPTVARAAGRSLPAGLPATPGVAMCGRYTLTNQGDVDRRLRGRARCHRRLGVVEAAVQRRADAAGAGRHPARRRRARGRDDALGPAAVLGREAGRQAAADDQRARRVGRWRARCSATRSRASAASCRRTASSSGCATASSGSRSSSTPSRATRSRSPACGRAPTRCDSRS